MPFYADEARKGLAARRVAGGQRLRLCLLLALQAVPGHNLTVLFRIGIGYWCLASVHHFWGMVALHTAGSRRPDG